MLQSVLAYGAVATKIKAMKGRMLNRRDFEQMAQMASVREVAVFLKNHSAYSGALAGLDENDIHRGQIEQKLEIAMFNDFISIYRQFDPKMRNFLNIYFLKYEIEILKSILQMILDDREISYDLSAFVDFFDKHTDLHVKKLFESPDLHGFVDNLKGSEFYPILQAATEKEMSLFDIEMRLDLYYFRMLWRTIDKKTGGQDQKLAKEIVGTRADIINIMWIYRAKRYYNVDEATIHSYLIPVHRHLSVAQIDSIVAAPDIGALESEIGKTKYKDMFVSLDEQGMQKKYKTVVNQIEKSLMSRFPYSLAIVIGYMNIKETEIENIISIIECVRYNWEPAKAMKRLI